MIGKITVAWALALIAAVVGADLNPLGQFFNDSIGFSEEELRHHLGGVGGLGAKGGGHPKANSVIHRLWQYSFNARWRMVLGRRAGVGM